MRSQSCGTLLPFAAVVVLLAVCAGLLVEAPAASGASPLDPYIVDRFMYRGKEVIEVLVPPSPPPPGYIDFPRGPPPRPHPSGATNALASFPALDWCYGCSATSAAMMFGWYDTHAFDNMYAGPTNAGAFPLNNSVWGGGECPLSATHQGIDGRLIKGHVDDYWIAFGQPGPDPYVGNWTEHTLGDCTADYMGTSQWRYESTDGSTWFYFYADGTPLHDYTGSEPGRRGGCHGMRLFVQSRGYTVEDNYSQRIYGWDGNTNGFTFEDFQAEIDAGRSVIIQVTGHSMVGFGYDTDAGTINICNTWDHSYHTMAWGGLYSGMAHYGVTVVELTLVGHTVTATIDSVTPDPQQLGQPVHFVGSGSDDWPGHTIAAYEWTSSVDGAIGSSAVFDKSDLSEADHNISLRVQCSAGTWSDWVSWSGNPLAIIDHTVTATIDSVTPEPQQLGQPVHFVGSGSDNLPAHTITAYEWTSNVDGAIGSSAEFDKSDLSEGDHNISLRVQCSGATWSDWVSWSGNPLRIIDHTVTATIDSVTPNPQDLGDAVHFVGSGSDNWPGHTITGYEWKSDVDGVIGSSTVFDKSDLSEGDHDISLRVQCSGSTWSDWVSWSGNPLTIINHTVTATIESVTPNPQDLGEAVHFVGSGSDNQPGHTITGYEWKSDVDGVIGSSAEFDKSDLSEADHNISLRVQCSAGRWSDWVSWSGNPLRIIHMVTITDGPSGDANPCASAAQVQCSVTAEDTHGHDLNYEWSAEGNVGSFDDATKQNPIWTAPENWTDATVEYTISVTVTCAEDDIINTTGQYTQQVNPVEHTVTITDGPRGGDEPSASGAQVQCSVTGEDNRQGHTVVYAWTAEDSAGNSVGSFDDATKQNPIWTAPENRTDATVNYTISATVTCAQYDTVSATGGYTQQVNPVEHTVTITDGPSGDADPCASAAQVQCSVTAQDSRQGHTLVYAWTARDSAGNNVGSFDDATKQNPIWTAPENRTDATVNYTISVTVTCAEDGTVSATGGYTQQVNSVEHTVTITDGPSGDANPSASAAQVQCSVTAEDSRQGHTLVYAWTAEDSAGNSVGSFDDATKQNPIWTAPANLTDETADYTISATATCAEDDTVSATGQYTQQVNPVEHTVTITDGPSGDANPCASAAQVQCSVTAEDSRGHGLTYAWTAEDSAGNSVGSFDDASAQNPIWTAPENRTDAIVSYTISVTVTCAEDDTVSATGQYTQQVNPVEHTVTITDGPSGDANPCASAAQVQCSVTAEDTHGHELTYAWSAEGNVGSFDDATKQNPIWTAPANLTDETADYTISVTVTCAEDDAVSATGQYTQQVNPVEHTVTITDGPSGDANPCASAAQVQCSVTAEDSREGHALVYAWTVEDSAGNSVGSFNDATKQNPIWTAPENRTDATVEYTIGVTVTCAQDDTVSATGQYTQQVNPVEHTVTIADGPSGDANPCGWGVQVQCSVTGEDSREGHTLAYAWTAEDGAGKSAGSFDDATKQNPIWTAPQLANGQPTTYTISVAVTCGEGMSASGSYDQEVMPCSSHTFGAGVRMVSVPVQCYEADPRQLGFEGDKWARWRPQSGAYVYYGSDPEHFTWFDSPNTVPGKGYWAGFGGPVSVTVLGTLPPDSQEYVIDINPGSGTGWVQIGCPRLVEIPWRISGAGALKVRKNGQEKTLAEAQTAGWCGHFAWGYRAGVGRELVCDPSVSPAGTRAELAPWEGYWFQAHGPCQLVIPPVSASLAALTRPQAKRDEGDWSMVIAALTHTGLRSQAVVGQAKQAWQIDTPPSFGNYVAVQAVAGDRRLGVDLKSGDATPVWLLEAETNVAGAEMTLSWGDLSELPNHYRPVLVDLASGQRRYMRTTRSYTYTASKDGNARRFKVEMVPSGEHGQVMVNVAATAAPGGAVDVRVSLSAAAAVDIEVLNIAGRHVATVCRDKQCEGGITVLSWNGLSHRGTRLPAGRYLMRVTARAQDGQQASGIAALQMLR